MKQQHIQQLEENVERLAAKVKALKDAAKLLLCHHRIVELKGCSDTLDMRLEELKKEIEP